MIKWRKRDRDAGEGKDALPLPRYTNHEKAIEEAIAQAIQGGINKDEVAVAVTRDGRVYVGTAVPPSKITRSINRHRYLVLLLLWIGKAMQFFCIRVLRLPYLFELLNTKKKRTHQSKG